MEQNGNFNEYKDKVENSNFSIKDLKINGKIILMKK